MDWDIGCRNSALGEDWFQIVEPLGHISDFYLARHPAPNAGRCWELVPPCKESSFQYRMELLSVLQVLTRWNKSANLSNCTSTILNLGASPHFGTPQIAWNCGHVTTDQRHVLLWGPFLPPLRWGHPSWALPPRRGSVRLLCALRGDRSDP